MEYDKATLRETFHKRGYFCAGCMCLQRTTGSRAGRDGREYFCRNRPVTGSLTRTVETCLTREQLDAKAQDAKDYYFRTQGVPGQPAGASPISSGVTQPQ